MGEVPLRKVHGIYCFGILLQVDQVPKSIYIDFAMLTHRSLKFRFLRLFLPSGEQQKQTLSTVNIFPGDILDLICRSITSRKIS